MYHVPQHRVLTSRANFVQVSPEIPITDQRNPDKIDTPDVFEGNCYFMSLPPLSSLIYDLSLMLRLDD